eukprot:CAMPEP_0175055168 /NCGR_PEP_ID=MMETSP0052_2-20121109/9925_1 /TAXON_ID=51329 ORGANISM="Polytomella parva, Strain SAG 63-3" /NCGR_SAMPLE_ID=MMETSP0052_2 /ASSEMBLY_ACC=CAM_ASM_000194 /LENGTH=855 /DNA_ID=CAMNT_0016319973 /DNA_START=59 /DNA_END=2623 /DNA_ORIENTATION=-
MEEEDNTLAPGDNGESMEGDGYKEGDGTWNDAQNEQGYRGDPYASDPADESSPYDDGAPNLEMSQNPVPQDEDNEEGKGAMYGNRMLDNSTNDGMDTIKNAQNLNDDDVMQDDDDADDMVQVMDSSTTNNMPPPFARDGTIITNDAEDTRGPNIPSSSRSLHAASPVSQNNNTSDDNNSNDNTDNDQPSAPASESGLFPPPPPMTMTAPSPRAASSSSPLLDFTSNTNINNNNNNNNSNPYSDTSSLVLPNDSVRLIHMLGLDAYHRNNISFIESDVIITAVGNAVVFLDLRTLEMRYSMGVDGGGIGAIAVHPLGKMYAVAEKCRTRAPNIYLYDYPSHRLVKVMRCGTDRAYAALAFEKSGDMLASVGSFPDYLLTLWDWKQEAIILRSKAFSQDIYTVAFSQYFEGQLTTSGMGHIRFWSMASTFTGLKLQGAIGKFGVVELSDVCGFLEFPDGKVLSGSETGELLLWDGGLIKAVLTRKGGHPCHDGAIEAVLHDRLGSCIVTGGADGFIRLWDFNQLNEAEAGEDSHFAVVRPLEEVFLGAGVKVKSLLMERHRWTVLDERGKLIVVHMPPANAPPVAVGSLGSRVDIKTALDFHSGSVIAARAAPDSHCLITAGRDGTVRLTDYLTRRPMCKAQFNSPITAFTSDAIRATLLVCGHKDGVLRLLVRSKRNEALVLTAVAKPHKGAITAVALSKDLRWLATCGEDKTAFFFKVEEKPAVRNVDGSVDATFGGFDLVPIAFTGLDHAATVAAWVPVDGDDASNDGNRNEAGSIYASSHLAEKKRQQTPQSNNKLLIGTAKGVVIEVTAPQLDTVDTTKTFEVSCPTREYRLRLPKMLRKKVKRVAAAAAAA